MRIRIVAAGVAALLAVTALAGCTASASSSSAGGSSGGGASAALDAKGAASAARAADTDGPARSVVTTGRLQLVAGDPIAATDRIVGLVEGAGGRVAKRAEDPGERPSARLELRIPAARFPQTLAAIERVGDEVRDVDVESTDVTARVTDTAVSIANLRTSIARLQQLLARRRRAARSSSSRAR